MRSRTSRLAWAALVVAALASYGFEAYAEEKAEATAPVAEAEPADTVDADALALLNSFGDALKAQPRFSFAVELGYEVVQKDGQKLEFGAFRRYTVRRPDHLRIDEERREGGARELYFDGDQLTVWIPGDKAYGLAKLKKRRDLDSMLDLMRDALDLPVPLGDLLRVDPLPRIEQDMVSAYVVGREKLMGVECDHVAWRTDEVNAEAWFTVGDHPLLQRLIINYEQLDGQPRFWAQFTNWSISPDVADSVFVFAPPADAERVRLSVRGRTVQPTEEQEP
jgi:hypothetical protein